jgi:hypothetical protein
MANRQKNKKPKTTSVHKEPDVKGNEYDLQNSFKRLKQHSGIHNNRGNIHVTQTLENYNRQNSQQQFIESTDRPSLHTDSGGMSWDEYTRLDNKLDSFSSQNVKDHTDLRHELENKIKEAVDPISSSIKLLEEKLSSRLSVQWYRWTIIGIVAIVGIWYMFSYNEIHPLPRRVDKIERNLDELNNKTKSYVDTIYVHSRSTK